MVLMHSTKQNGSKYFEFSNELKKTNHVNFLNIDKIGMFSSKIHSIINNIMDSEGIIYIYSNFIYGGVLPLALALEQNGISKFGGKDKQLLNSDDKKDLICYKCKIEIVILKGNLSQFSTNVLFFIDRQNIPINHN